MLAEQERLARERQHTQDQQPDTAAALFAAHAAGFAHGRCGRWRVGRCVAGWNAGCDAGSRAVSDVDDVFRERRCQARPAAFTTASRPVLQPSARCGPVHALGTERRQLSRGLGPCATGREAGRPGGRTSALTRHSAMAASRCPASQARCPASYSAPARATHIRANTIAPHAFRI